MDPAEVEFLAEKEIVTVVPNFSQDKIYLIGVSRVLFYNFKFIIITLTIMFSIKFPENIPVVREERLPLCTAFSDHIDMW